MAAEAQLEGFRFASRWRDAMRETAKTPNSSRHFFLGVFDGGALVALGGVTPDPYADEAGLGRVRHVYVASAARRRGYGRQLLSALEERARRSYSSLRLRTDTERAAVFYESLGYSPTDETGATHRRTLS